GKHDRDSQVFERRGKKITRKILNLKDASLASQAVGPPLSPFEMSFDSRTWPDVGRKMLPLHALAGQDVHPQDSVLAGYRNTSPSGTGLDITYEQLVQAAFKDKYWDDSGLNLLITFPNAKIQGTGNNVVFKPGKAKIISAQGEEELPSGYTLAQANFSMFFGIAVMWYEATLVPDRTPFDVWMEGDGTPVTGFGPDELAGLNVFVDAGKCVNCHGGPEFTNASVRNAQGGNNVIEPMLMGDRQPAFYDNGFYNIGVTPTVDDLGRGNKFNNGDPLAFSRQFAFEALNLDNMNFPIIGAPIQGLDCERDENGDCIDPTVLGFIDFPCEVETFFPVCTDLNIDGFCGVDDFLELERVAVDGAFKTPTVRLVELTGPFMHNGGFATLREVVKFYNRGGNFCRFNKFDLDPDIQGLNLDDDDEVALVAFMISLTDPRVRYKEAPFDHPELRIPNGGTQAAEEPFIVIDAVGENGGPALQPFLEADQSDDFNDVLGGVCSPDFPACP
ncbi:MAG: hypothetical protein GTN46_00090, partial [Gammaproteobacteria bacterium]|nr:hypothetical protein [Gammaproteobacteria bacterium]